MVSSGLALGFSAFRCNDGVVVDFRGFFGFGGGSASAKATSPSAREAEIRLFLVADPEDSAGGAGRFLVVDADDFGGGARSSFTVRRLASWC